MCARLEFSLLAAALTIALVSGCATRFQEPQPSVPHATLAFPTQAEQWAAFTFLEPVEFNGVPRPRRWMRESFRVPPGELQLGIRAAFENLQGTCQLVFPVAPGQTYAVAARFVDEVFLIRVTHNGHEVAACESPSTLLPTPRGMPPRVPP